MRRSIMHFVWGYQQQFRFAMKLETERILGTLNRGLQPDVFLIGVRVSDNFFGFIADFFSFG